MDILRGIRVVNLALNLPGPLAANRLARMGAEVVKVEPPAGDPMELYSAAWYREMAAGQELVRLDPPGPDDDSPGLDQRLQAAFVLRAQVQVVVNDDALAVQVEAAVLRVRLHVVQ